MKISLTSWKYLQILWIKFIQKNYPFSTFIRFLNILRAFPTALFFKLANFDIILALNYRLMFDEDFFVSHSIPHQHQRDFSLRSLAASFCWNFLTYKTGFSCLCAMQNLLWFLAKKKTIIMYPKWIYRHKQVNSFIDFYDSPKKHKTGNNTPNSFIEQFGKS